MTNQTVIENKISSIKKYLGILAGFKRYSQKEIEDDVFLIGSLERYLYLAVQAAIDLAEAVISYQDLRKPSTMAESFRILNDANIISAGLTDKLADMAGFRNIIAHDYEDVDKDIIYDVLKRGTADIEKFICEIEKTI